MLQRGASRDKLVTAPFFKHAEKKTAASNLTEKSPRLDASGQQPVTDQPEYMYISDRLGSSI